MTARSTWISSPSPESRPSAGRSSRDQGVAQRRLCPGTPLRACTSKLSCPWAGVESFSYITWRQAVEEKKHWSQINLKAYFLKAKEQNTWAMKEDKTVGRARRGVRGLRVREMKEEGVY